MNATYKVGFFLSVMMLFISCGKEGPIEKRGTGDREYGKLVVKKYFRWYGNSSQRDKQIFEIYDNNEDFHNCLSEPLKLNTVTDDWWYDYDWMFDYKKETPIAAADTWFRDWNWMYNDEWDTDINVQREVEIYDSIKCGKTYYIKSFLAYNHDAFVDYNDFYEYKMGPDSVSVINVITERHYMQAYLLNNIEIRLPAEFLNEPNLNVQFAKIYPSSYAGPPNHIFFDISVSSSDFPLKKTVIEEITEFNSWWWHPGYYITITTPDITISRQYEIRIFDLLNKNKALSGDLTYYGPENEVMFKLSGTWIEKEE